MPKKCQTLTCGIIIINHFLPKNQRPGKGNRSTNKHVDLERFNPGSGPDATFHFIQNPDQDKCAYVIWLQQEFSSFSNLW
jgi:hypothetical protein